MTNAPWSINFLVTLSLNVKPQSWTYAPFQLSRWISSYFTCTFLTRPKYAITCIQGCMKRYVRFLGWLSYHDVIQPRLWWIKIKSFLHCYSDVLTFDLVVILVPRSNLENINPFQYFHNSLLYRYCIHTCKMILRQDLLNGTLMRHWPLIYFKVNFLCHLRSIAAHRGHFVRRLSVRPLVTLSW